MIRCTVPARTPLSSRHLSPRRQRAAVLTPTFALLIALALLLTTGCGAKGEDPAPVAPAPAITQLAPGWNAIDPGGDTMCSDGSPFRFFVRPGSTDKVHFYLEGGGACWNGPTCDVQGRPSYSPVVNESDGQSASGVFDFERTDNPLREYSTIFVPYCSGDVHLGDRDVDYTASAEDGTSRSFTIHHRGLANGRAALAWMYTNTGTPSQIFVSGSSAGAIPSPVYAYWIAEHWPEARVTQLGDGAGGYRGATEDPPYRQWGTLEALAWPELTDLANAFSFEDLYVSASQRNPDLQLSAYDTAEDDVQLSFLALGDRAAQSLQPLLEGNRLEIKEADKDFRVFLAGGDVHTILRRPEVYTFRVGDVTFLDWLTRLVQGQPVDDVLCTDCSVAETVVVPATIENGASTGGV